MSITTDFDPAQIQVTLDRILESQYFRSSAQCQALLRYIVENTVAEKDSLLRERVIGAEVFKRPPDYDTGNDHIVRSRVSEVRKRLAQYYAGGSGGPSSVRIQIPSGSYQATFDLPSYSPLEPEAYIESTVEVPQPILPSAPPPKDKPVTVARSRSRVHKGKWAAVLLATVILIGAVAALIPSYRSHQDYLAFQSFWEPILRNQKPALIYSGGAFVYTLSDRYLDKYSSEHHLDDRHRHFFAEFKEDEQVPSSDLIPDNHYVPYGDLVAAARLTSTLAQWNKPYDLRFGNDVAFTEFHASPIMLVGGFNNPWTMRFTKGLRYGLEYHGVSENSQIVDQWHRETTWADKVDAETLARDDYALISRLPQAATGGFILSVAGIRMYGTRTAAEFISDPARIAALLKGAPKGWENRNLQIVLHTRVVNDIPVLTDVEAVHFW